MTSPQSSPVVSSAGAFAPPPALGDFTLRFVALLDGLALQRLQQMRHSSRKYLTELAMHTARTELAPSSIPPGGGGSFR